jgi:hypothetical protein
MIKDFIRRIFNKAGSRSTESDVNADVVRPTWYQDSVEEHLRRAGMQIENRKSAFPTLRPDQFTTDIGATARSRRYDPLMGPGWLR